MTDQAISPLRQRMIDDMTIRKLGAKTQAGYIRAVKNFAAFAAISPDQTQGREHHLLSVAPRIQRARCSQRERHRRPALLLQSHAAERCGGRRHRVRPRVRRLPVVLSPESGPAVGGGLDIRAKPL